MKNKLFYAAGGVSEASLFMLVNNYLLFFLTGIAGMKPASAGIICGMGTLISAFCGPVVGYLSDRTKKSMGKRRFFIALAAVPYTLSLALCFTAVQGSDIFQSVYYGLLVVCFWCSYSCYFSPWTALGAVLTDSYSERLQLREWTFILTQVGVVFGASLPPLAVELLGRGGAGEGSCWQLFAMLLAALDLGCIGLVLLGSKGRDEPSALTEKLSLRSLVSSYIDMLRLKHLPVVLISYFCYIVAQNVYFSARVYQMNYNMGLSAAQRSFIVLLQPLLCILFSGPITKLCEKTEKKTAVFYTMLATVLGFLLIALLLPENMLSATLLIVAFCAGSACIWQLAPTMNYDVCEYDAYMNGKHRDGIAASLLNATEMAGSGIATMLLGLVLQLSGFAEGAALQSDAARAGIRTAVYYVPAVLLLLCALIISRYSLSRSELERISAALKEREK